MPYLCLPPKQPFWFRYLQQQSFSVSPLWFPLRNSFPSQHLHGLCSCDCSCSCQPQWHKGCLSDCREIWLQPPVGAALEQNHFLTQQNLFLHHQYWWEALGIFFVCFRILYMQISMYTRHMLLFIKTVEKNKKKPLDVSLQKQRLAFASFFSTFN